MTSDEKFNFSISAILKHEGGYSNHPSDSGGPTNYGISFRLLKDMAIDINHDDKIDFDDIKEMEEKDAIAIYRKYWWDKYKYYDIDSPIISSKIFDMSVHMGPNKSHKITQTSCTYCGYSQLKVDGILGYKTINALNEIYLHGRTADLMNHIVNEQAWFYENLTEKNPKLKVFLNGWLKRAAWTPDVAN